MKAVIDTNVLVSRAISDRGAPARIFRLLENGAFELLVTEEILAEYRRALGYEHVQKAHRYTTEKIESTVLSIRRIATVSTPDALLNAVPADPDDDKFIECAFSGGADYIVSGDKHLLALGQYKGVQIVSPAVFLALLEAEQA